jgi:hypothetical protein
MAELPKEVFRQFGLFFYALGEWAEMLIEHNRNTHLKGYSCSRLS